MKSKLKVLIFALLFITCFSVLNVNMFSKDMDNVYAATKILEINSIDEYDSFVNNINTNPENYRDYTVNINCDLDFSETRFGSISINTAMLNFNFHKVSGLLNPLIKINEGQIYNLIVENCTIEDIASNETGGFSNLDFDYETIDGVNKSTLMNPYTFENVNGQKSYYPYYKAMGVVCNVNIGTIGYCGLTNVYIKLTANADLRNVAVGGVAGVQFGGIISNCYVYESNIKSYETSANDPNRRYTISGGIVGLLLGGEIQQCITSNNTIDSTKITTNATSSNYASGKLSGGIFGFVPISIAARKYILGAFDYQADMMLDLPINSNYSQNAPTCYSCFSDFTEGEFSIKESNTYDYQIGITLNLYSGAPYITNYDNLSNYVLIINNYIFAQGAIKELQENINDAIGLDYTWVSDEDSYGQYTTNKTYNYPYFDHNPSTPETEPEITLQYYYANNENGSTSSISKITKYDKTLNKIKDNDIPTGLTTYTKIKYDNKNYILDGYAIDHSNISSYVKNNLLIVGTSEDDLKTVQEYEILEYRSSGLEPLSMNSSFIEGKTYKVYPVYVVESYKVFFNYNTITCEDSTNMPQVTLTDKNTNSLFSRVSYGYTNMTTNPDFTVTEPIINYGLHIDNLKHNNYYILWCVYYNTTNYESNLIANSLGEGRKEKQLSLTDLEDACYKDNSKQISWDLKPGANHYIIQFQIFPKVEIKLDPNPSQINDATPYRYDTIELEDGTTLYQDEIKNGKLNILYNKPQVIYALTGTDILFASDYSDPVENAMKSTECGYSLLGFYTSKDGVTQVLNSNYSSVADGEYFNHNYICQKTGTIILYAKWERNDVCKITVNYVGVSKPSKVYNFYYMVDQSDSLDGVDFSKLENLKTSERVSFGLYLDDYTWVKTTYSDNAKDFLTTRANEEFYTSTTAQLHQSGYHEVTITVEYKKKGTDGKGVLKIGVICVEDLDNHGYIAFDQSYCEIKTLSVYSPGDTGSYTFEKAPASEWKVYLTSKYDLATDYSIYFTVDENGYTINSSGLNSLEDIKTYYILYEPSNTTEEPDENVCVITVKYVGVSKNSDIYYYYYKATKPDNASLPDLYYFDEVDIADEIDGATFKELTVSGAVEFIMYNTSMSQFSAYYNGPDTEGKKEVIITAYYSSSDDYYIHLDVHYYGYYGGSRIDSIHENVKWYYNKYSNYTFKTISNYTFKKINISNCGCCSSALSYFTPSDYGDHNTNTLEIISSKVSSLDDNIKNGGEYGAQIFVYLDYTGSMEEEDDNTSKTISITVNAVFSKYATNELQDYELKTQTNYKSYSGGYVAYYSASKDFVRVEFKANISSNGKITYRVYYDLYGNEVREEKDGSYRATGWTLTNLDYYLDKTASFSLDGNTIKDLTKPNGYIYSSSDWCYDNGGTGGTISFDTNYTSYSAVGSMIRDNELIIYQDWQYGTYTVTMNKNKYSTLGTKNYTAGSNLALDSTVTISGTEYPVTGWKITKAQVANNDTGYNISTEQGFKTSISESNGYNFANYTYSKSNLMYGNFTVEPIFDEDLFKNQKLVFDFGITGAQYISGYSNAQVYGDKDKNNFTNISTSSDTVTFEVTLENLNTMVDLSDLLNPIYEVIPKFYQNGNVKYYLVGWTGASYKGTYKEENFDYIYMYDKDEIPGNVVTDSPITGGGKIYAVWATLYEIRIALNEDATKDMEVSLYNKDDLIQRGDDLKINEPWQDSFVTKTGVNYYTFFYGETLTNNPDVALYFDPKTAIGSTPSANGYSLSYKCYDKITSLGDLSLKTLSGYQIFGTKSTTSNYVYLNYSGNLQTSTSKKSYTTFAENHSVQFNDMILYLINNNKTDSIINIVPEWEDLTFNVIVNGDDEPGLEIIENYKELFTVNAKGKFDFWPDDANTLIASFEGWYLDTLTDNGNGELWEQTIDGKKTSIPIGTDFYNKILKINNNKVENIYTINDIQNEYNKLILTLEFNATYVGAIYALEVSHINANGTVLTSAHNFTISETPDGLIDWQNASAYLPDALSAYEITSGAGYNKTLYSATSMVRLLPKYSYDGSNGFDNHLAFEEYKNNLFVKGDVYYITLEDKVEFNESKFQELTTFESAMYSLDFYDYTRKNNDYTRYVHMCYDINTLSIEEASDGTKVFKIPNPYTANSTSHSMVVNYKDGVCDWNYDSAGLTYSVNGEKKIYARWVPKVYDLDMAVQLNGTDSNSGYIVATIKNGSIFTHYAYVYLKDGAGNASYKLYNISSTAGSFYATNGWKDKTDASLIKDTTILEVPAGSTVTLTLYSQYQDIYLDDMIGYRFSSVDIKNPYCDTIFNCEVGNNTFINFDDCEEENGVKKCSYTKSTTATSSNYINSTGLVTVLDFTNVDMNKAFELHEKINFVAKIQKINYILNARMDNDLAGTLSYTYKKSGSGLKNFSLNDITVGDSLKVTYSSSLGYQINGWDFVNNKGNKSTYETTSLVWTDGQDATQQPINAKFLKEYAYKGSSSYPIDDNQVLGTVSPNTSLIEFTLNVTIYNETNLSVLESYVLQDSTKLVSLNTGNTVSLGGSYKLILNPNTDKAQYDYYLNSGVEYAILKMYIAHKYSREYETKEYNFPIKNLSSLDFNLTSDMLSELIRFTAGVPVSVFNRELKVVVFVSPIVEINAVTNEELKENADPYDILHGKRELKAGTVVIASAQDAEYVTKKDVQYAYIGQKVTLKINSLNSRYYTSAKVSVNQTKEDIYTLASGGEKEITIYAPTKVNIQFVPATYDLSVNFLYQGNYYKNEEYGQILNLADVQVLEKKAVFNITDTDGNERITKFYYDDILRLSFGVLNFNELFRPNNELKEYTYRVLVNGATSYATSTYNSKTALNSPQYEVQLLGATNVVIEIINVTTNTVRVHTNLSGCGSIYGVTKSETTKEIKDAMEEFVLLSGDDLTIYIKVATGFKFLNYVYQDVEYSQFIIENVTEGQYVGYIKFILVSNYNITMEGEYTLMFEEINYEVKLVLAVDGEENNNAGSGYYLGRNTTTINGEISVSNLGTSLENEGYRFIGYTVGITYFEGQDVIDNGNYDINIKTADYSEYIDTTEETIIVYVNFVRQYKINITNKGKDFEQTKVSLLENGNYIFKDYSNVKMPYNSDYIDSSNYTDYDYKLVVDTMSGLNLYYINLYCNNVLVENVTITKDSVNNNASAIEYTFRLDSKDFNIYSFSIEYMPETLKTTLKEYYINDITEVQDYVNNGNLPNSVDHEVLDKDANVANKSNMVIKFNTDDNNLFNRYNVIHNFNISIDNSNLAQGEYSYSIYQVWINDKLVLDENIKTTEYNGSWTITENTDIKVIYKALYKVY